MKPAKQFFTHIKMLFADKGFVKINNKNKSNLVQKNEKFTKLPNKKEYTLFTMTIETYKNKSIII